MNTFTKARAASTGTVPPLVISEVPTPIGALRLLSEGDVLVAAAFAEDFDAVVARLTAAESDTAIPRGTSAASEAISAYLGGDLTTLANVEVSLTGTPFQLAVWDALREIEAGHTITYGELARRAGHPRAVRAVGSTNGANPIAIVVPCHRVIPATGGIGGYRGGPDRKRWLLQHEAMRAGAQAVGSST